MMNNIDVYESALKSATYFHQPGAGFLQVAGRDRVDFLQRQSTNDLRLVRADHAISTVLTSPTARILDLFCVVDQGENLGLVSLPERAAQTYKFLKSRVFFSDQVSLTDLSMEVAQILLMGPQVGDVLQALGLQPPISDQFVQGEIAGQPVSVVGQKLLTGIGYRILVSIPALDSVVAVLDGAGVRSVSAETFEILRIEAGQPGPEGELVDAFSPLEIGLHGLISDSKGCYTGQEIIARQITYHKVSKCLVGVKLDAFVSPGAEIKVQGKSAGTLTSANHSPRFGPIGLGVVRRPYRDAGTILSVVTPDKTIIRGIVVELPFTEI